MGLVSSALNLVGDAPGEECCWLLGSWAGRGWGWLLETGQGPAVDAQTGTGCRLQTLVVRNAGGGCGMDHFSSLFLVGSRFCLVFIRCSVFH